MDEPEDIRRKRLLYQASRRGFKEADLVIGGFAAREIASMSARDLDEFERLLAHPDQDLYAWALGEAAPDPSVAGCVLDRLKAFAR
ncbi:MAG: succinate dehydrogenase assembly factor 2 [Parvularculaceae bacterium]